MLQKQDKMQRIKKGIGTGDRWDMVRLENGIIGYISQNYVEELPDVEIEKISNVYIDATVDLGDIDIANNDRSAPYVLTIQGDMGDITVG